MLKNLLHNFLKGLTCAILALVYTTLSHAQQFKFNHYTASNGLSHQYIYDLTQSENGYLWLATSTGIIRFDGSEFESFTTKDGLAEDFSSKLFSSSDGKIWIGHNKGGISVFKNGLFKKISGSNTGFGNVVGFDEIPNGGTFAVGQSGKVLIQYKNVENVIDLSDENLLVSSMGVLSDKYLLLGTDAGIYSYKLRKNEPSPFSKKLLTEIPEEKIQCIVRSKSFSNSFWVATSSGDIYKIALLNDEFDILKLNTGSAPIEGIQNIFEDNSKNLWVSSYSGVHKLVPLSEYGKYTIEIVLNQGNGLPSDQVKCVFQDRDNNKWFGMYGGGLAMLKDEFFTFYKYKNPKYNNNILSIYIEDGKRLFGSEEGLGCFDCLFSSEQLNFPESIGLEKFSIISIKKFNNELVVGTSKNGVFAFNPSSGKWRNVFNSKVDNLVSAITDIDVTKNSIWIGTRGGLFELDANYKILRSYNTENGLSHNSINDIFVDKRGRIWALSQSNMVALIEGEKLKLVEVMGPSQSINIISITQDPQNKIWMATYGNGVFHLENEKFVQLSTVNGLASDYCYFIAAGKNNTVWVGHRGALSLIKNGGKKITVFSSEDGIDNDFNERAAFRDNDGSLWFGSTEGIVKFDPSKYNSDPAKPKINLKSILISDKPVSTHKQIELPYGNYRLVISFIGINFNNPQKVKYKYFLKGFDLDWSDISESNQAYYPKLSDGEYEFIVKACNEDGMFSSEEARIKIIVSSPFWKKWWFFALCFLALSGIIILIIRLRERSQRRKRIFLEKQLLIRTKELVEQKALVELKNKDITDSINYAYKIQSALLPSLIDIKYHLPDIAVLNKPRDIVSGDFYWYNIEGDYITIALADCTGHGVPGSFMSAIGNLIFRRVNELFNSPDPALFIHEADLYLTAIMNKQNEIISHDGMDMVMVKLNYKTGELIYSGARRPLLLFRKDGYFELLKTSSDSIGGHLSNKTFEDGKIQLSKGDIIYMYSDGIVDQFNEKSRKKILTKGLINLIQENFTYSTEEQLKNINNYFEEWKGNGDQIDDVIVVAFRF